MSTSTTTNLGLVLDNVDEPVKTHHRHANANLATLDVTIKSLQDSMANAKALLGQLGIDANDHYVVDAETARTTLGVPSSSDIADIVRQNVPLMSPTTLGGAKLEEHGGLVLRDEKLGIGSLVQESDGYARGGLAEVTAKGHAEQVSTTGKNLLPNTATSQTVNGVTFTVNADGSITASGTASDTVILIFAQGVSLQAGNYTLSGCPTGGAGDKYDLRILDSNQSVVGFDIGNGTTLTLSSGTYSSRIVIRSGQNATGLVFYPQLELGSTATEYEPYTGGAPSPSPDYPQEIQVVRGRNLLPKMVSQTVSGITATVTDDGEITLNGTASAVAFFYTACNIEAGAYTLSTNNPESSSTGNLVFKLVDGQIVDISGSPKQINSANTIELITTATKAESWVLRIASGASFSNFKLKPQLTLGSTPHPYVPYGHVGMEVRGKKNLFGGLDMAKKIKSLAPNSVIDEIAKTVTFTASDVNGDVWFDDFEEGKNYTFILRGTGNKNVAVMYTNSNGITPELNAATVTDITASRNVASFGGQWYSGSTTLYYDQCGIFEGVLTLDDFEPYYHSTTPIPLPQRGWVAGLPDGTADVLTLDGAGKVEWTLNDDEVVLNGSSDENWGYTATSSGKVRMYSSTALKSPMSKGFADDIVAPALCSHLAATSAGATFAGTADNSFAISPSVNLYVFSKEFQIASDLVAWLQSNPVTVLYPLATPVTEDCGYVEDWPTDIPEGAVITIPELDEVGIRYFVDSAVTEYGRQMYARAYAELGDAITELAARVTALES